VSSKRLNFVDNSEHLQLPIQRVGSMRARREYFNLGQN